MSSIQVLGQPVFWRYWLCRPIQSIFATTSFRHVPCISHFQSCNIFTEPYFTVRCWFLVTQSTYKSMQRRRRSASKKA